MQKMIGKVEAEPRQITLMLCCGHCKSLSYFFIFFWNLSFKHLKTKQVNKKRQHPVLSKSLFLRQSLCGAYYKMPNQFVVVMRNSGATGAMRGETHLWRGHTEFITIFTVLLSFLIKFDANLST